MGYIITVRQGEHPLRKEVRNMEEMTTREISRLIDWLKEHGHTYEEIEDCIDTISKEKQEG